MIQLLSVSHFSPLIAAICRSIAIVCEICGISVDDHIGRSVRETVPQVAEQVENIVQTILRTGNPITGIEVSGQRPDGGNAERVWLTNWYPLIATDGSILGINVASEEITERKRMEAAFAASEAKSRELTDRLRKLNELLEQRVVEVRQRDDQMREVLDALPAAVYTTDAEGTITYCNRAAVDLAGREPALGKDKWCVTFRIYTPDGRASAARSVPNGSDSEREAASARCRGDGTAS